MSNKTDNREKGKKNALESDDSSAFMVRVVKNKQGKFVIKHTIHERPAAANDRAELGHFESDTVLGMKGGARLVTQVERLSRYTLADKTPDGTAENVRDVMIKQLRSLPEGKVKSVTPDRGHEFAKHAEVSRAVHDVPFYFADPHSPWQRGTNENTNGLLRQYFPKGISLDNANDEAIAEAVNQQNHRPRKCLNWRPPHEVFFNVLLHLI